MRHWQRPQGSHAYTLCQTEPAGCARNGWFDRLKMSGRWLVRIFTLTPTLSHQGRGSEIAALRSQ